ncbi:MAG TPA: Fe-S cluster assembly protein SufD [Geobacterales bacterium]|nr:Fe-S cluster assembly protein SufD [Geobacterales bacterium]
MSLNFDSNILKEISYYTSEPSWLREERYRAWEIYNKLPIEISPLYVKHHDITKVNLEQARFELKTELNKSEEIDALLDQISSLPFISLKDGEVYKINIPQPLKEKGLEIHSIRDLLNDEDNAKKLLSLKSLKPEEDKFQAFNDAFFSSGFYISVPSGLILKLPLRIINFQSEEGRIKAIKNFINVGADSRITILEENYSLKEDLKQSLYSLNLNLNLGEAAEVEYILINDFNKQTNYFVNRRAACNKDARITWVILNFGTLTTRAKTDNAMNEQGVISNMNEIVVGDAQQVFDLTTYLSHNAPFTKGVSMTKGVLKDESRALFKGLIIIEENAKNADAYLAEHAMILNRGARADSIPGLEIKNNEVRATHSASVAQVDEEQIFYLMSRGLSEDEAKKFLTIAFFQPLIDQIPAELIKEEIANLIENKLENKKRSIKEKFIITEELKEVKTVSPEKLFETHYKYRK